jgi:alcohol dehydrogenase class IV
MNLNAIFSFYMPTKVVHGLGAVSQVGREAKRLRMTRVVLVTDPQVKGAGLLDRSIQSLGSSGIQAFIFDEVEVDPGIKTVSKGVELAKVKNCDGIIIVGGGSPMCAGKGIALVCTNGGSIADYEGNLKYRARPLPVIGIPTTAGAGSEVSGAFIITDEERNYKMGISGPEIHPDVAILDPHLLLNIPFWPGVNAGMDALSHAVGACCTNEATLITDSLAITSTVMILKNLARSVLTNDLTAKDEQLVASAMANIACGSAKLDLTHALSHPLGSFHMPHGLANGILMPYVMEFNLPVCEEKFAKIAIAAGENPSGMTKAQLARKAIAIIKDLYIEVGFPRKLPSDVVNREKIPEMVNQAMTRPMIKVNKRRCSEKDLAEIYSKAFAGW